MLDRIMVGTILIVLCLAVFVATEENISGFKEDDYYSYPYPINDLITNYTSYYLDQNTKYSLPDENLLRSSLIHLEENACRRDLGELLEGIVRRDEWAMLMLDATAKLPSGLLKGNVYQFGNFDECVTTRSGRDQNNTTIVGQYCLIDVFIKNKGGETYLTKKITRNSYNSTIHWGVCVPSSCRREDVEIYFGALLKSAFATEIAEVTVPEMSCHSNKQEQFVILDIVYGSFIGLFLVFIFGATVYHSIHVYRKSHSSQYCLDRSRKEYPARHEIILAFSLVRNVSKLLEIKNKNSDFNLDCISGLKALSMLLILAGHALVFLISSPVINANFHEEQIGRFENAIFLNNPLMVDTFLLLSGFLMSRMFLLELEKRNGNTNVFYLYLFRYLRLTPVYLVVLGFYCTFFIKIGDGPLWNQRIELEQQRCINSWWSNILYINNYVNTDQLCMFQSWYLSVDTQLFIIAPIVIYLLWLSRFVGLCVLVVLLVGSAIIPAVITYMYNLDPTLMIYAPEIQDLASNYYFRTAYIKTHMRANAYVFGVLVGYIIHKAQSTGFKISHSFRLFAGIIALLLGTTSLFSITIFYMEDHQYSPIEAALYSSIHRIAWVIAIGWIIFICVTSSSGFINNLLCWKAFVPFSKITYSAYLVNGVIELYNYGTIRVPKYLSVYTLGMETTGHIVLTISAAFILCVLFESPIHNLEKLLIKRRKKSTH